MVPYVPTFVYYAIPAAIILYSLRKYRESKWGRCKNKVSLQGKIVIVTGANCGIGYEIAKEFSKRGAKVILACRSEDAALNAILKIEKEINAKQDLVFMELDLASLISIKQFADKINQQYDKIHILVNNAGVSYPDDSDAVTKDGYEIHFGVNHLGHFFLTNLLLDKLENGNPSRVVIVSSLLHQKGAIEFDSYDKIVGTKNLYANSKLMNMYFCKELSKKVKDRGINVYAVCPGWVFTSLFRHNMKRIVKYFVFILPVAFLYMRTANQGAQTAIYCATEPNLSDESGGFYRDCDKFESKVQFCEVLSKKLWATSVKSIEESGFKV
ncbi:retinol dehydrogenase 11-like [Onthophagus taurus]|uniref:retinol dehydrogenase 11-like n=1 Tax=Onthophagus taurus TaxID=166361 RepID=UPI0039BE4BDB